MRSRRSGRGKHLENSQLRALRNFSLLTCHCDLQSAYWPENLGKVDKVSFRRRHSNGASGETRHWLVERVLSGVELQRHDVRPGGMI